MILRYILFSFFSILINIIFQEISLYFYSSLIFSILLGTLLGFITKYLLDKHFIFSNAGDIYSFKEIFFYTMTAIFTTVIFWTIELLFIYFFETKTLKILGAFLGLVVGYFLKYHLDSMITFKSNEKT